MFNFASGFSGWLNKPQLPSSSLCKVRRISEALGQLQVVRSISDLSGKTYDGMTRALALSKQLFLDEID